MLLNDKLLLTLSILAIIYSIFEMFLGEEKIGFYVGILILSCIIFILSMSIVITEKIQQARIVSLPLNHTSLNGIIHL